VKGVWAGMGGKFPGNEASKGKGKILAPGDMLRRVRGEGQRGGGIERERKENFSLEWGER